MADQRTTPSNEDSKANPTRPFDRQALQATLADAVRIAAADSDPGDAPPGKPLRSPSPQDLIGTGPAASDGRPRPAAPRPPNPFSRPVAAPPAPAAAAPAVPTPVRPAPSMLGGGTPTGVGTGQGGGINSLTSAGPPGMGGLRSTSPDNLGPINFSGDNRPPGELNGGRTVSGLAPTPTDGPTIPLRRRQPAETSHSAKTTEAQAPTPAPAPASHPIRSAAPIDAWMPGDDDILPRRVVKRSFRLVR
jgi:hypothetical protein